jgi:hypothetical protein
VNKVQAGFKLVPLSRWGKEAEPVAGIVDPAVDTKTPPKATVDTMPGGKFFAYAAEILKLQPHIPVSRSLPRCSVLASNAARVLILTGSIQPSRRRW